MPNLIDKLITRVDTIRQKAADKFGLPSHNLYRVIRTWSGGEIGSGTATDVQTLISPTPRIKFSDKEKLFPHGRDEGRSMKAYEISLTYTENFLQGDPKAAGQECFYKLEERNGQQSDPTYWILSNVPFCNRAEVSWELEFTHYTVCG